MAWVSPWSFSYVCHVDIQPPPVTLLYGQKMMEGLYDVIFMFFIRARCLTVDLQRPDRCARLPIMIRRSLQTLPPRARGGKGDLQFSIRGGRFLASSVEKLGFFVTRVGGYTPTPGGLPRWVYLSGGRADALEMEITSGKAT